MTVYLGADHRGFELKEKVIEWLASQQIPYEDFGAYAIDPEDDFNDPAIAVAAAVRQSPEIDRGILLCGSSYGVCIQANRFKSIRAISGFTPELAHHAREHDDANILCLDASYLEADQWKAIVDTFLTTDFLEEERYIRRRERLDQDPESRQTPPAAPAKPAPTQTPPQTPKEASP